MGLGIGKAQINNQGSSGGSGHTIQDSGSNLTQRTNLNFVGSPVTVSDDSSNDATVITVSSSSIPSTDYYVSSVLGDDSNAGTSIAAPFKTIQNAINQIPPFFNGNTTLHLASDVFTEEVTIDGYNPNGPYSLTIKGYINSSGSQFSDEVTVSGTSTGPNSANFPTDQKSILSDTRNPFTSSDDLQLVKITHGTGFDSTNDYENYFRAEQQVTVSGISIVTKWLTNGTPSTDTQYEIYRNADMSTVWGEGTRDYGFHVDDSSGIVFEKVAVSGTQKSGFFINDSRLDRIVGCNAVGTGTDVLLNEFWFAGFHLENSSCELMRANLGKDNYFQNFRLSHGSRSLDFRENLSTGTFYDAGFQMVHGSSFELFSTNLSKSDAWTGFSFTNEATTYRMEYNRVDSSVSSSGLGGGTGMNISGNTIIAFSEQNVFTNCASDGILVVDAKVEASTHLFDPADTLILNNTGFGINLRDRGIINSFSYVTISGNTLGAIGGQRQEAHASTFFHEYDDFISGDNSVSGEIGKLGWHFSGTGVSVTAVTPSPNNKPGTITIRTGSTASQDIKFATKSATLTSGLMRIDDNIDMTWIVNIPAVGSDDYFYVLHATFDDFDKYLGIFHNPSISSTWRFQIKDSSSGTTTVDSGVTCNVNQWYKLRIKKISDSQVDFFIDDRFISSITTNIPTGDFATPGAWIQNGTSNQRTMHIDYFEISIPSTTR